MTKQEFLFRLEDEFIGAKVPVPTFVIDSGRGIYLIWKLRKDDDAKALPRWERVEQYLTDALMELGADQACTDAARILRVPFSWNDKSKSKVKILDFNDLTYSIYDIEKEYGITGKKKIRKVDKSKGVVYPYNHATERQRKYVRDLAKKLGLPMEAYPDFTDYHETDNWIKLHKDSIPSKGYCYKQGNVFSLNEFKAIKGVLGNYCADIRKLFSLRKGADCKREIALFLYRYFLREMKMDRESALRETLSFNASLSCPFDESYVATVTASADRRIELGIPYAYKKSTIIKILDITKDELAQLPFLSADSVRSKELRSERNRRAYQSRLAADGKVAKKDAILSRRAAIIAMQDEGKSPAEIQESLHISRATYHRDIAALAVSAVLEAARAAIAEQAEKVADAVESTAEGVSDAVESITETASSGAVCHAFGKVVELIKSGLSQKFSRSIYSEYGEAVPHSQSFLDRICSWLYSQHGAHGRRSDCSSDDGQSDDAE